MTHHKYESAFQLLGQHWGNHNHVVLQTLVYIGTSLDFESNHNRKAISAMFAQFNDDSIHRCLQRIKEISLEDEAETAL